MVGNESVFVISCAKRAGDIVKKGLPEEEGESTLLTFQCIRPLLHLQDLIFSPARFLLAKSFTETCLPEKSTIEFLAKFENKNKCYTALFFTFSKAALYETHLALPSSPFYKNDFLIKGSLSPWGEGETEGEKNLQEKFRLWLCRKGQS